MSFTRRYMVWLLGPPAVVTGPLALLFLTQVLPFSASIIARVIALVAAFVIAGTLILFIALRPSINAVDAAKGGRGNLAEALTACLDKTKQLSATLWLIGSLLFAAVGSLMIMPTAVGFSYFLVAALIAGFSSVVWAYASGKDRKSTRLNSSHPSISYAVFCLKKKKKTR